MPSSPGKTTRRAPAGRDLPYGVGLLILGGILASCASGCSGKAEGFERYVPDSPTARGAVVAMLENWRDGKAVEELARRKPSVCIVDKHRKPGQRLVRFELMGEVSTDAARGFAARLTLEKPEEEQVVRFLAVGIDPLWVFRQEDYELFSHWMHPMEDPDSSPSDKTGPTP